MSQLKILTPRRSSFRKARLVIGYPLNGGTEFSFDYKTGVNSITGELLDIETAYPLLPNGARELPLPEEMMMGTHIRRSIIAILRRLAAHPGIEICVVPFSSSANIREALSPLYGTDYRFLSGDELPDLVSFVEEVEVGGGMNLGDFYRRTYYLFADNESERYQNYYIDIIPSTTTFSSLADFNEGMPLTPEQFSQPLLERGDNIRLESSRLISSLYDKTTGKYNWDQWNQYINNYGEALIKIAYTNNLGGPGYGVATGVVDEHSLSYITTTSKLVREVNAKGFHFNCPNVAPPVMATTLKDSFGITAQDNSKTWFDVTAADQYAASINTAVTSILEELKM